LARSRTTAPNFLFRLLERRRRRPYDFPPLMRQILDVPTHKKPDAVQSAPAYIATPVFDQRAPSDGRGLMAPHLHLAL